MKSSTSRKTANSKSIKSSPLHTASVVLVVLVLVIMGVLLGVSYKKPSDAPVILIYGADKNLPEAPIRNTLYASGFDYHFVSNTEKYENGSVVIPEEYRKQDIIIMSVSDSGFELVKAFANKDNVNGFILVCPDFPGNASMEGINSQSPAQDIAIFAGRDKVSSVAEVDGARLIYERISGDDTVYGTPIKRGEAFASDCFISAEQNRYLSLSYFDYNDGNRMLRSQIFLSELASYLDVTHNDIAANRVDSSRITNWSALRVFTILVGIAAFCLFLFTLPNERSSADSDINKKIKVNRAYVIMLSISSALAMASVVLAMINKTNGLARYFLVLSPIVVITYMLITTIIYLGKVQYNVNRRIWIRASFMAVSIIAYVLLAMLLFANLAVENSIILSILLVLALIDAIASGLLSFAKKAGGLTYYGNWKIQGILCVPGVLAIVAGLLVGKGLLMYGIASVLAVLMPLVLVTPIRRHANHPAIIGLVHGSTYLLILLAIF